MQEKEYHRLSFVECRGITDIWENCTDAGVERISSNDLSSG